MSSRFLRAIRLDSSDQHVFPLAAGERDWLVPGSIVFASAVYGLPQELAGKPRQAFVSGFLSVNNGGFSTLACISPASEEELAACTEQLTVFLRDCCGAPSRDVALEAARQEIAYARELADGAPVNSLLALQREIGEDGDIRESFRIVSPPANAPHARIWDVVEDD